MIPTLNRCEHLEQTLLALRDQTYQNFEVVVVNGPSVDGTAAMLLAFADRATLATCARASVGMSRNVGVSLAVGDIVAFIDDDAIPPTDWLDSLVAPYADDSIAAVGGAVFDVPLGRIEWNLCTCSRLGSPDTDSPGPIGRYLGRGADPFVYLAGCNMSFRRAILREVGGFNPLLTFVYDDAEVCCRVIDAGFGIAFLPELVVRHERASNAYRDDEQSIRDPYSLTFCRAVFALQCEYSRHNQVEIEATIRAWVQILADEQLDAGQFAPEQQARFVERARAGAEAGIAAAASGRPIAVLGEAPGRVFRPYR